MSAQAENNSAQWSSAPVPVQSEKPLVDPSLDSSKLSSDTLRTEDQITKEDLEKASDVGRPAKGPYNPEGLHLEVDFAWRKFRNTIYQIKDGQRAEALFVQHFRFGKPQLRFDSGIDGTVKATGRINCVSISGEMALQGRTLEMKPLRRLVTAYNFLSHAFAPPGSTEPVPLSFTSHMDLKRWDFVCMDPSNQPIAKFSANFWALKQVGNIYFMKPREELSDEQVEEVVVSSLLLMYIMMMRVNNPLNLLGAAFTKVGKVKPDGEGAPADFPSPAKASEYKN